MGNVIEIESQEQLDALINENAKVVVDFWATWCQPCARLKPHFEKAAERSDTTVFAAVEIEDNPWATSKYGIMSVPQVKAFENSVPRDIKGRTVIQLVSEIGA